MSAQDDVLKYTAKLEYLSKTVLIVTKVTLIPKYSKEKKKAI